MAMKDVGFQRATGLDENDVSLDRKWRSFDLRRRDKAVASVSDTMVANGVYCGRVSMRTKFQRTLLAAIIALTIGFSLRSNAQGSRVRINILGLGAERCDILQSAQTRKGEITLWIEGFWSGVNYVAAASDQKQSIADTDMMMAEVENVCRRRPSQILATAAWTAFLTLNER